MDTVNPRAAYLEKGPFLVTVVLRAGSNPEALSDTLGQLKDQTIFARGRMEVLVVGEERTGGGLAEFSAGGPISYIAGNPRETAAGARNRAIKKSRSEFLTLAEPGDRFSPDAIEKLARELERRPETAVVFGDTRGAAAWQGAFSRERLFEVDGIGPHPMWRRSLHQRLGFFDADVQFASEYEFFLRVSSRHQFLHVPEVLSERPQNGGADEAITGDAELDLWSREIATARNRYWMSAWGEHPREKRVTRCFASLRERLAALPAGINVALFGAGKHTGRMLERFHEAVEPRHRLCAILDDRAEAGQHLGDIPVVSTPDWQSTGAGAIVVSSDAYEATMLAGVKRATGGELPVLAVYSAGRDFIPTELPVPAGER